METNNKLILIVFILAVLLIAMILTLNFSYFQTLIRNYIMIYGLPAVFLLSLFGEVIDQPFGADSISILGISFGLNPYLVFTFAVFGCWIASLTNFYIGRRYLARGVKESCSRESYVNYCKLYFKYGKFALVFSALVFPYIIMTWLSGALGMELKDFILYGLVARAIRIGIVLLLALGIINIFVPGFG